MIADAIPTGRGFAEERAIAQDDLANLDLACCNALPVRSRQEQSVEQGPSRFQLAHGNGDVIDPPARLCPMCEVERIRL